MSARKLNLRSEILTDLTPAEMHFIAGAEAATQGGVCTRIIVGTAVTTLITQTIIVIRTGEIES